MDIASLNEWWPALIAIIVCLCFSSYFSATETALTTLSEAKVHQLFAQGIRTRGLRLWLNKPSQVLTTLLVGNNIVNILASSLATAIATAIFKNNGIGIAVGIMTFIILIFGEVVPKTFAKHNADKMVPWATKLLSIFYVLFYPAMIFLNVISNILIKATGGKISTTEGPITEEELEFLIDLGQREGVLEKREERMLHSVLDLSDTVTREIMVPRTNMIAVSLETDYHSLISTVLEAGYSRVPVYEGTIDNIAGIVHAKDLLQFLEREQRAKPFQLRELLRPVYYVPESMSISDLLVEFQRRKTHLAVVVDEYGGTAGIVAMEDILEEIVGEIHDEHDIEEKPLQLIGEGHYLADAFISIDDLGEQLGVEFPEEDAYDTLGGFIVSELGHLPAPGESKEWNNLHFVIKEADEKRVLKVEIKPLVMTSAAAGNGDNEDRGSTTNGAGRHDTDQSHGQGERDRDAHHVGSDLLADGEENAQDYNSKHSSAAMRSNLSQSNVGSGGLLHHPEFRHSGNMVAEKMEGVKGFAANSHLASSVTQHIYTGMRRRLID